MHRLLFRWSLLLCLCFCTSIAKAQPGFDKVYSFSPYPAYDLYSSIRTVLPDTQRIFLAGTTIKDTVDHGSFSGLSTFLAATDYSGNVQWQKRLLFAPPYYQSSEPVFSHLLAKLSPEKYVLGNQGWDVTTVPPSALARPYLYFFKPNGDSLKFVPIPASDIRNEQFLYSVLVDRQSNIIATGPYWDEPGPGRDTVGIWLAKFDSSGSFLWRKIIVNPNVSLGASAFKVINSNDGKHYLLGGESGTTDTSHKTRFSVWKTDTAGNVIWQRNIPKATPDVYPDALGDQYFDIIPAVNGSGYYFMAAEVKAVKPNPTPSDYQVVFYCGKLNDSGKVVWGKTYRQDTMHNVQCVGLAQRSNGDLLFMGQSSGFAPLQFGPSSGPSLLCTDSLGRVKWYKVTKRYDCTFDPGQALVSMKLTPNGGIVRGGAIFQQDAQPCFDTSGSVAWLVLTDSLGRRTPTDTVTFPITADSVIYPADTTVSIILIPEEEQASISLYPNPTTGMLYLELKNLPGSPTLAEVQVLDYMGRLLRQQKLRSTKEVVDLAAYSPGLYLVRLRYKDREVGVQKIIKR